MRRSTLFYLAAPAFEKGDVPHLSSLKVMPARLAHGLIEGPLAPGEI